MRENPSSITVKAPAKVNFFLKVTGRRPDGYHNLVSVMQALELSDEVTVEKSPDGISVSCDSAHVPAGPENIAFRAAKTILDEAGVFSPGVRIHIKKNIPVAAGLGGGSSDAAATLKGINLLFKLGIPDRRLRDMGIRLGADVPFFLSWPRALAEGVGEVLSELPSPDDIWLVIVNPGFPVSTGWVFGSLNFELTNKFNSIKLPQFEGQAPSAGLLASYLHNDLERVTVVKYPQIRELEKRLVGEGALGALMSGSGPTVFGVFEGRSAALEAARKLAGPGLFVQATRTISAWPEPHMQAR
jgi:4-diphosphocytidyl-2-C-methyl-D-erythritol kinase